MLGLSVIILLNLIFNVNSNLAVQRYSAVIKISIVIFKVTSLLTILCRHTDNQIGNTKMGPRVIIIIIPDKTNHCESNLSHF